MPPAVSTRLRPRGAFLCAQHRRLLPSTLRLSRAPQAAGELQTAYSHLVNVQASFLTSQADLLSNSTIRLLLFEANRNRYALSGMHVLLPQDESDEANGDAPIANYTWKQNEVVLWQNWEKLVRTHTPGSTDVVCKIVQEGLRRAIAKETAESSGGLQLFAPDELVLKVEYAAADPFCIHFYVYLNTASTRDAPEGTAAAAATPCVLARPVASRACALSSPTAGPSSSASSDSGCCAGH